MQVVSQELIELLSIFLFECLKEEGERVRQKERETEKV